MPLNNHLRKHWKKAGYSANCGSAASVAPPTQEYKRLYYLTSVEYAVSNIVLGRLKVARFSQLNDPFELLAPIAGNKKKKHWSSIHRQNFDSEYGLLCFSEDWIEPVLWSHYGARHQGICLGFDVTAKAIQRVTYQSERLKLDRSVAAIDSELAGIILRTKFDSWRYERESRVLVQLSNAIKHGDLHFVPFSETLRLSEVILGPLCDLDLKEARSLVAAHCRDVAVIKSRLAWHSFHVVPLESTVPKFL